VILTDKEWSTFFLLLDRIVNADGMSVADKCRAVKEAAEESGDRDDMNLEEFVSWRWD